MEGDSQVCRTCRLHGLGLSRWVFLSSVEQETLSDCKLLTTDAFGVFGISGGSSLRRMSRMVESGGVNPM